MSKACASAARRSCASSGGWRIRCGDGGQQRQRHERGEERLAGGNGERRAKIGAHARDVAAGAGARDARQQRLADAEIDDHRHPGEGGGRGPDSELLASDPSIPDAAKSQILTREGMKHIDPQVLTRLGDVLGGALTTCFWIIAGMSVTAFLVSLFFPKKIADPSAAAQAPVPGKQPEAPEIRAR